MPIPTLATAPTLDGSLIEYAEVAPIALDQLTWGAPVDPADLSATARVARVGGDLYVAVEVRDDRYVPAAGIAGDHVEVWVADPRLDRERVWVEQEEEVSGALKKRARAFRAANPRRLQVVSTPTGLTDGKLHTLDGDAAYRATETGWTCELRIPLMELPRLAGLSVRRLQLRVDLVDADGAAAQDSMLSDAKDRLPERTLAESLVLGDDPWATQQLGEVTWRWAAGDWRPFQPRWEGMEVPGAHVEAVVGWEPARLPIVEGVEDRGPARTVDGARQWLVDGVWEDAAGTEVAAVADGDAAWVVYASEEPEFGSPHAHSWGTHTCAAAADPTWTVVRWTSAGPEELDRWSYSGCAGTDDIEDCALDGLTLTCTRSGKDELVIPFDRATRRWVVPTGE